MWSDALEIFHRYMGTGLITIWFLTALVYLLFREKRKHVRILFLYVPVIILLLFFHPVFIEIFYRLAGDEIYFRICWLLPVTVVIAYGIVVAYGNLAGSKRKVFAVFSTVLLAVSGTLVYSSPLFTRAENIYHVPQTVVDICDSIVIPGREVRAVFPSEFLLYVRQYSPVVCMPYGRGSLQGYYDELEVLLNQEVIDVSRMVELSREKECHYIILSQEKTLDEEISDYHYEEFGRIDGYVIYKDVTMNFDVPSSAQVTAGRL
ncbi:MAG: hypothetical protein NC081_01830 [Roseburia sp.]|nr:hypothetical protein [Roseburia sp.]